MAAIDRKLMRELRGLKGQIATIALVLAGGITCFICLRGTWLSLDASRERYYDRYRFAHVFVHLEHAPEALAPRLRAIPGVAEVETRITEEVALPIAGMDRPAYARLLSLPDGAMPLENQLHLREGRLPARRSDDEVALLAAFAEAHHLHPGDRLPAVVNHSLRTLRIVGTVLSPEYVYAIRPGALADDPKRYAVLWMARTTLASAFQLEGSFNDVTLRLEPGASEPEVRAAVDRLLQPYGGLGAQARREQVSNRVLTGELSQLEALAGMVPMVFLAVVAFLVNMVLRRLIQLQRPEIATLKAIGYSNREVGRHYLGMVAVVFAPGALLGVVGGVGLGRRVLGLYAGLFRFPDLTFTISADLVALALGVSLAAAAGGAFMAVRAATRLPPAEAMRPPAPAHFRRGIFDRLGLGVLAGPGGRMVLREIERHPLRTALSSLGMAGAIALMILGRFGTDSLDAYLDGTYRREQRQDLAVSFARPVPPRAVGEMARLDGVVTAEGIRAVPVRIHGAQRTRDSVLLGLPDRPTLRQLVGRGGPPVELPEDGILASRALGHILDLHVGDRPEVEVREGRHDTVRPVVSGFVDEAVGLQLYGRRELVAALERDRGAISTVLLRVQPEAIGQVEAALRRSPLVIDVADIQADVARLRAMNASMINVWTLVSLSLGGCVIFGVVYNNARISLADRARDLGTLRVLGFSRGEISTVLVSGLLVEVALAIPLGLGLGRLWAQRFMSMVDQEMFRWQVVVTPRTYLLAAGTAALAAVGSALVVRRKLDRLDLIGVLKERE